VTNGLREDAAHAVREQEHFFRFWILVQRSLDRLIQPFEMGCVVVPPIVRKYDQVLVLLVSLPFEIGDHTTIEVGAALLDWEHGEALPFPSANNVAGHDICPLQFFDFALAIFVERKVGSVCVDRFAKRPQLHDAAQPRGHVIVQLRRRDAGEEDDWRVLGGRRFRRRRLIRLTALGDTRVDRGGNLLCLCDKKGLARTGVTCHASPAAEDEIKGFLGSGDSLYSFIAK